MGFLRQNALKQKLLQKFEKWCKFSSSVNEQLHKMQLCKMRPGRVSLRTMFSDILNVLALA
jgi:hypothetical protein